MRTNVFLVFALVMLSLAFSACGGPSSSPNTAANTATANSNNPLETNKSTPEVLVNNGPTLTPVFKAYCAAWQKNDEAALRKIWSADTIKGFEEEMKAAKEKNLLKFLSTDKVSGDP